MRNDPFYHQPFDFQLYTEKLYTLPARCPGMHLFSAGESVLGKPLWCLFAGDPGCAPVLLAGGTHGSEWITSMLLTLFAETLADTAASGGSIAGIRADSVLQHHSLILLPCLNPDGVEIAIHGPTAAGDRSSSVQRMMEEHPGAVWQANVRGVDLNHNFDAGWEVLRELEQRSGICVPGPTRFGGPCPFSEPETAAVRSLCGCHNFRQLFSFHAQGEEIYWRYGSPTPGRGLLIARILAASSDYTVCDPTGTAAHGGMKDWFIQQTGRPGFTIEVGKGQNPLPLQQLESIWERLQELMMLSVLV